MADAACPINDEENPGSEEFPVDNLPTELLECILHRLRPYRDLHSAHLVSHLWYDVGLSVLHNHKQRLVNAVTDRSLRWRCSPLQRLGTSITGREFMAACFYRDAIYAFGGGTVGGTKFNDIWKLDLSDGRWGRILAMGKYPPPTSNATMVQYNGCMYFFGGSGHAVKCGVYYADDVCYNTLYCYNPESKICSSIQSNETQAPFLQGHKATVHKDKMVVFGGCTLRDSRLYTMNTVWVFDFASGEWSMPEIVGPKPPGRQGHAQIRWDDDYALIVGGTAGPNHRLRDVWILRIEHEPNSPWMWQEVKVENPENSIKGLYRQVQGCKIGNKAVFLDRVPEQYCPLNSKEFREDMRKCALPKKRPQSPELTIPIRVRPSIRPNASANHEIRLAKLEEYLEKQRLVLEMRRSCANPEPQFLRLRPLYVPFILNCSRLFCHNTVSWEPPIVKISGCFPLIGKNYSLVLAHGEIVVFGGIPEEHQCCVEPVPDTLYLSPS